MADAATPGPSDADDSYGLSDDLVRQVRAALAAGRTRDVQAAVADLHAADVADLIEFLDRDERVEFVRELGAGLDPEVLSRVGEPVRDDLLELLGPAKVAAAVAELDTDDAVYVLEDLEPEQRREVLSGVAETARAQVEAGLAYDEDTAGRLMQRDLIAVPEFWTVGQTIDYLREADDLPDDFYEIYVVDPAHRPIGAVPLNIAMRTKRHVPVVDIMVADPPTVPVTMEQEEVAYLFTQYGLASAPVVDETGRLIGVILVDDIVEVVEEEAEEDLLALSGVRDDDLFATVLETARTRFTWLLVNLATAILASIVIGLFDATIEQMVALAVLMPIVASMGGNAGTQTLAITIRALATRELTAANAWRLVAKEVTVGAINGVLFAILIGLATYLWFGVWMLGGVIAAAMVVNMVVAGLSGILIPLGLDRAGVDPAVASSVFLTTLTDVIGFFAFLGLGALFLM